jgi:hypothetical protein
MLLGRRDVFTRLVGAVATATASICTPNIARDGFQWARAISGFRLLEHGDPIAEWRHRMLELHGRLTANAPGYAV